MRKYILFFFFALFISHGLFAQKVNADSLYKVARQQAFSGNYVKARYFCNEIIQNYPDYYDAYVLKGRTFAWAQQYDSARIVLSKVYYKKPNYSDALSAMIDVEMYAKQYEQAQTLCDQALKSYPYEKDFLEKKSRILLALGKKEEAVVAYNIVKQFNPKDKTLKPLFSNYHDTVYSHKVSVDYVNDKLTLPISRIWEMKSFSYEKATKAGKMIGRLSTGHYMADGINQNSNQFEFEGYPEFSDRSYSFLNYSYSPGPNFPRHRIGLEYFQGLKKEWEASVGIRYLSFIDDNGRTEPVQVLTLSLSKYYHKWWLSFRPYFTTITQGNASSYVLTTRYYPGGADNYFSVEGATGSSPDDPKNYSGGFNAYQLKSTRLKLGIQHMVGKRFQGMVEWGLENQEYLPGKFRENNVLHVRLSYLF